MAQIVCISGFAGIGKSTVSKLLFEQFTTAALIEADALFQINPFEMQTTAGRNQIGRIKLQNSLALLHTYVTENFDYIVIDGLIWSQPELDSVLELTKKHAAQVTLVWLDAPTDIRHKRAIKRARDEGDAVEFVTKRDVTPDPRPFIKNDSYTYLELQTQNYSSLELVQIIVDSIAATKPAQ